MSDAVLADLDARATAAAGRIAGVTQRIAERRGGRRLPRPTPRAVAAFAIGIPVAFLVVVARPALWPLSFTYALVVLLVIVADGLMILRQHAIALTVAEPARLPVGEEGLVRVDISTRPELRPACFTIVLEQTGYADLPATVTAMTEAGGLAVALPIRSDRRGRIVLDALWLRWRGPLGLIEQRWRSPLDRTIDIVPQVRGLRDAALMVLDHDARHGTKAQRQRGEGAEFETLREHVQGLDNRHIDWKRSARHVKLLSKTFRTERNHQIVLAFDTGHLMLEPIEGKARLDHAIEAGLLLGYVSLKSGDQVGSFAFDASVRQFIPPDGGLPSLARLQHAVSRLAYANEETNFTLGLAELNQRLRRRALVVIFTEFVDTVTAQLLLEGLQRIANRHAIIFITLQDPLMSELIHAEPDGFAPVAQTVIAQNLLRERAIVLEKIARMGIHILDVPVRGLSSGLVNKYLLVKERGQI